MVDSAMGVLSQSLPTGRVTGRISVPGSKSVAQRILNLALLARSPITIADPPTDQDSHAFVGVLEALGWELRETLAGDWSLSPPPEYQHGGLLDCGSSGTGFRFLVASLSTFSGHWTLTGSRQLSARPIQELVEVLSTVGCKFRQPSTRASLPLEIQGRSWSPSTLDLDAKTSSQYLSALLMAATVANSPLTINVRNLVSAPYADLTVAWMRRFGAQVDNSQSTPTDRSYLVHPGLTAPQRVSLEGDWSSAVYPAAGAALTAGFVELAGVDRDSAQGDLHFLDLLQEMGAKVSWTNHGVEVRGGQSLRALDVDLQKMPDQVPTLACIAPFAHGTTLIRGVAHLRHKESDRLKVLARELTRVGAVVEERADGLRIEGSWYRDGPPRFEVEVDPEDDHRIAMAMAVLAAKRSGVTLRQPQVVAKSNAGFWQQWRRLFAEIDW